MYFIPSKSTSYNGFFDSLRHTIPQGFWEWTSNQNTPFRLVYTFDFFNYAGIHRPVVLYTKPKPLSISDVTIFTQSINIENHSAVLKYHVKVTTESNQAGKVNININLSPELFPCDLRLPIGLP